MPGFRAGLPLQLPYQEGARNLGAPTMSVCGSRPTAGPRRLPPARVAKSPGTAATGRRLRARR